MPHRYKINRLQEKDASMGIPYRPLGIVTEIIERMGLEVSYSYEDLVFVSHNAFLFRFGEQGELLDLFFNHECPEDEREPIVKQLSTSCEEYGLALTCKGTYALAENSNNTISINFFEASDTPATSN